MTLHYFADKNADTVLIQPVDEYDMAEIENEVAEIKKLTSVGFQLIAVEVEDWNSELSPWEAPAVFGNEGFGSGAADTLAEILKLCSDKSKTYYIGGYSLAGLFALWAAFQTDVFSGVAAASPSVWFPNFVGYMKENKIKCDTVYLSLGDREEKTKNAVMSKVGDCIRESYEWLTEQGIDRTLEWNKGGHFKEPALRTARAFAWVMRRR